MNGKVLICLLLALAILVNAGIILVERRRSKRRVQMRSVCSYGVEGCNGFECEEHRSEMAW